MVLGGIFIESVGSKALTVFRWGAAHAQGVTQLALGRQPARAGPVVDRRECEQTEHEAIEGFLHQTSG